MTKFDEYVAEIERRHEAERKAAIEEELSRRYHGRTYDEALNALLSCMTFPVGVSDVLQTETAGELVH